MRNRITNKDLYARVEMINKLTKSPEESYTTDENGKYTASPGNFHIDGAYGGVRLVRICPDGHGTYIISGPYTTKRGLYIWMGAYIQGLSFRK